jgi:hypothetical protein
MERYAGSGWQRQHGAGDPVQGTHEHAFVFHFASPGD